MIPPENKQAEPSESDRIVCADCRNLNRQGRCSASRTPYVPLPDLPRRCLDFMPLARLQNQANGKVRFPGLIIEKPAIDNQYEKESGGE